MIITHERHTHRFITQCYLPDHRSSNRVIDEEWPRVNFRLNLHLPRTARAKCYVRMLEMRITYELLIYPSH